MLDFVMVSKRVTKKDGLEVFPKFIIKKSSDLMIRGGDFYAIWVEDRGFWSEDEQDAIELVDRMVRDEVDRIKAEQNREDVHGLYLWDASSGMVDKWHRYCQHQMRDNYHQLDNNIVFSNQVPKKGDYATKRLSYPLEDGTRDSYDKLLSVLYRPEERHKIEWAIGAIVCGESKKIQKFLVLYGSAGTGKSTVLNIIQQLFDGYYSVFDAKALGSNSNSFALEAFKSNPLVAIQHDGDLSRIEDNTRLNSLVSHELMTVNEKFKSTYANRFNAFLFMGTNKPVKITDGKSGLLRRLIDVSPTGDKIPSDEYKHIMDRIPFELGGIAYHCKNVYESDPNAYDDYIPTHMLGASNDFYNFMVDSYPIFERDDGTTLRQAWEMYRTFCDETKVTYPYSQRMFKEELRNYFRDVKERVTLEDGNRVRTYFTGLRKEKFNVIFDGAVEENGAEQPEGGAQDPAGHSQTIGFDVRESEFDKLCADCPAQYAKNDGTPQRKWENVGTVLSDLQTDQLHYVRVPENHIVIDFDIPDKDGNKDFEANLKEASKWPPTYAELSKSGAGIHLHYIYTGDPSKLSSIYDDHIEVKVFTGKSSLRRKLTKCNDLPINQISSGLPLKGDGKKVNFDGIKNERQIRTMIKRNLNREYHPNTKPSMDFIAHILESAYDSGIGYDVSDMRNAILAFAASSTNQAETCVKMVSKMKFKSDDPSEYVDSEDKAIIFFDVEVFSNLFVVCWKRQGPGYTPVKMINPKPEEIEKLLRYRLVGFNNRKYDDHILYAALMGYSTQQLYKLSNRIINDHTGFFGEAYNLSYTDIYDFAAKKQSLKKWEIELGIHHQELGLPWDEPVPEELWDKVAEYCCNDVVATEAVFDHLQGDFTAREILADLAGMSVNDTTNRLTTRIIFGKERHPELVYTDLATGKASNPAYQNDKVINAFPGYEFVLGDDNKMHNMFRGVDLGMGGYVYAEPNIYRNVALLDIASLHPHSIKAMNVFGKFTQNFVDLMDARMFIKHGNYDAVRHMFGGKLVKYLQDESTADQLAQALKIAINSVYGLSAANFDNPFRDIRNKNNIVALRGALFMKTLQDEVVKRGFTVAHIKTDSIKIPEATPEIIEFCMEFAKQYGYKFEHEATYDRMCLVNNAVYIAKYSDDEKINGNHAGKWTATGAQFQVPYIFKTLFTHEPYEFKDFCETKSVQKGNIYLDRDEGLAKTPQLEKDYKKVVKELKKDPENPDLIKSKKELESLLAKEHNYIFVGRVGLFTPVKSGSGGGVLVCDRDGKKDSVAGTKGYRWLESEMVEKLSLEDSIDKSYYRKLADEARDAINEYGDFEAFVA